MRPGQGRRAARPCRGRRADPQAEIDTLRTLRRARDRIDREYAEPLSVAAMAAQAGYSPSAFIRAFQAAYGETPGQYRTRRRVERACELLRSASLSVTEVCFSVGFSSPGSFSARFSTVVGRSPSAYRDQARRGGGPAPIPACFALRWRVGLPAGAVVTSSGTISKKQVRSGRTYTPGDRAAPNRRVT
jgi:AraC-like DNA-binding protein